MINKTDDTRAFLDQISDYANEYGDQEMMAVINVWLLKHMGRDYAINCGMSGSEAKILAQLSSRLTKVAKQTDRHWEYLHAMLDVKSEILNMMTEG
jgi:hypothetical protein